MANEQEVKTLVVGTDAALVEYCRLLKISEYNPSFVWCRGAAAMAGHPPGTKVVYLGLPLGTAAHMRELMSVALRISNSGYVAESDKDRQSIEEEKAFASAFLRHREHLLRKRGGINAIRYRVGERNGEDVIVACWECRRILENDIGVKSYRDYIDHPTVNGQWVCEGCVKSLYTTCLICEALVKYHNMERILDYSGYFVGDICNSCSKEE